MILIVVVVHRVSHIADFENADEKKETLAESFIIIF